MLPDGVPDITALELLDSVAELGSLGRAAARHHLSQPAVSMRMSGLERRLGLSLLQRSPAGARLTPAGTRIVAAGRRVLAEAQALMTEVATLRAEGSSRLRIAASLTVADYLLPAWIAAVHHDVSGVSLALEVTNSSGVLSAVGEGRADIGFVEGKRRDLPGMDSEVILGDHLVVVVSPDHPWTRLHGPIAAADVAATELIVREKGSGTREIVEEALARWGGVRTRLELGSPSAIRTAARRGEGPAVLSELTVADDLADGRLVAIDVEGLDLTRSFRAVWLSDRPLPSLAARLLGAARA
ncbi:MAG: putative LysR family transcriptional regulator [Acidimicrobiaceae bacterium]|nr:putative LysR family transcriptional regulator [Acidimicrobiaceae bacterium]